MRDKLIASLWDRWSRKFRCSELQPSWIDFIDWKLIYQNCERFLYCCCFWRHQHRSVSRKCSLHFCVGFWLDRIAFVLPLRVSLIGAAATKLLLRIVFHLYFSIISLCAIFSPRRFSRFHIVRWALDSCHNNGAIALQWRNVGVALPCASSLRFNGLQLSLTLSNLDPRVAESESCRQQHCAKWKFA